MPAKIENANRFGRLTPARLRQFESALQAKAKSIGEVPKDYRKWLLVNDGGRPQRPYFTIEVDNKKKHERCVDCFFALHDLKVPADDPCARSLHQIVAKWNVSRTGVFPIGRDTLGN